MVLLDILLKTIGGEFSKFDCKDMYNEKLKYVHILPYWIFSKKTLKAYAKESSMLKLYAQILEDRYLFTLTKFCLTNCTIIL